MSAHRARLYVSPTRAQRPTEIGTPRPTRLPASHPRHGPQTAPAARRYWNRGRQRYCRSLVRYCSTLGVSGDRAANRAAHTRGKPRLLDVGRRIPSRDRFAPDSPLEGDGFETSSETEPSALGAGDSVSRCGQFLQRRSDPFGLRVLPPYGASPAGGHSPRAAAAGRARRGAYSGPSCPRLGTGSLIEATPLPDASSAVFA